MALTTKEIEEILLVVRKFVNKAKYTQAVRYLEMKRRLDPDNIYILARLATLRHEDAFGKSPKLRERAYQQAARDIYPLLKRMRGLPVEERGRHRNEYYWFSQQHLKQYKLGVSEVKSGKVMGYYSMGVGSANHAYKLLLKGQRVRGLKWAKIAQKAWEGYFRLWRTDYHDPYAWYALALGLQGLNKEAEASLKRSAKLAGISIKDPNLMRIRRMISEAK